MFLIIAGLDLLLLIVSIIQQEVIIMVTTGFNSIADSLRKKPQHRLSVANGIDKQTIEAVAKAVELEYVSATLVGDARQIRSECKRLGFNGDKFTILDIADSKEATEAAIGLVHSGEASLLMKGLISTDLFMKAILNKEKGILPQGALLSHVTVFSIPVYPKFLIASDVAIIPQPTLDQKVMMTRYLIDVAHQLGIKTPRVAFLAATEKIIPSMVACTDAQKLKDMAGEGLFGDAICDGPLSLDLAVDPDSAKIKGFTSDVAGRADCLLFPNIESGNVFYKTNTKFCGAQTATVVLGTNRPVVLTSRGDTMTTKLNSIALAALLGRND